jgi:rod shape-determining protein MreC
MATAAYDRTPPPFFRQGPSALTKLAFFAGLAIFLMVADTRFQFARPLRATVATVLLPVQQTLAVPVDLLRRGSDYVRGLHAALAGERAAREQLAQQSAQAVAAARLVVENDRLRALLDLRGNLPVRSLGAEVLHEAADPYSRKLVIDRGATHGVVPGAPVLVPAGVLGQVTRVFPMSAQVTLTIDKDAAIPVLNARTRARSVAVGGSGGDVMELRYMAANADVRADDLLVTSGIDGVYPADVPVARVQAVERRGESGFARIVLQPAAQADGVRHVLVLVPVGRQLSPLEGAAAATPAPAASAASRH